MAFLKPEFSIATDAWTVPEQLLELAADDSGLLRELIGAFCEDTGARLKRIREAAVAGDSFGIRMEAHTIKGGSRQIGAGRLAEACHQLEVCVDRPAASEAAIDYVESRFAEVRAAMVQYLDRR